MVMFHRLNDLFSMVPHWFVALFLRVSAAVPFWLSGRSKVNGWDFWNVNFAQEFVFSEWNLPVFEPKTWATLASISEHIFPALLVLGLFSRHSALALLGMTLFIQILAVPTGWPTHILWAGVLLPILVYGPGLVSLDRFLGVEPGTKTTP